MLRVITQRSEQDQSFYFLVTTLTCPIHSFLASGGMPRDIYFLHTRFLCKMYTTVNIVNAFCKYFVCSATDKILDFISTNSCQVVYLSKSSAVKGQDSARGVSERIDYSTHAKRRTGKTMQDNYQLLWLPGPKPKTV